MMHSPNIRRAFSLVEMLVALAIVIIALSVVTTVFAVTSRTTQTARGLAEVNQGLRAVMYQIEQDLSGVNPAESILVLSGWTQAAGRTQEDVDARRYMRVLVGDPLEASQEVSSGFDPLYSPTVQADDARAYPLRAGYSDLRSDMMMFFTNRPGTSKAPATDPTAVSNRTNAAQRFQKSMYDGTPLGPQLVLYGHAALGRAYPKASGGYSWPNDTQLQHVARSTTGSFTGDEISEIPALRWQLARRAAIIQPLRGSVPVSGVQASIAQLTNDGSSGGQVSALLGDLEEQMARLTRFNPASNVGADCLALDLPRYLAQFQPTSPGYQITSNLALADPYSDVDLSRGWTPIARDLIQGLMYRDYTNASSVNSRHFATIIENPPPSMQSNLGLAALPACVWFQVEFLMPEDPRNSRQHLDSTQWDDTPRWVTLEHDKTYVFVPDTSENRLQIRNYLDGLGGASPSATRKFVNLLSTPGLTSPLGIPPKYLIRTWPWAIRITVRALDPAGHLAEPIVRSYVHRFD